MAAVLVVEDEAVLLVLAESVIRSAGYETLTASTLSQAQALISSTEHFDLVVISTSATTERLVFTLASWSVSSTRKRRCSIPVAST